MGRTFSSVPGFPLGADKWVKIRTYIVLQIVENGLGGSGDWKENHWKIRDKDVWGGDMWTSIPLSSIKYIFFPHFVCSSLET